MNIPKLKKLDTSIFTESDQFKTFLADLQLNISDFTCHTCKDNKKCPVAYDLYNLNGNCLLNK
jgi:hypothetical protein